jgi:hypothetical protein
MFSVKNYSSIKYTTFLTKKKPLCKKWLSANLSINRLAVARVLKIIGFGDVNLFTYTFRVIAF